MNRLLSLLITSILSSSVSSNEASVEPCASLSFTDILSTTFKVVSIEAKPQHNFSSHAGGPLQPILEGLDFCQVKIYITHGPQDESTYHHSLEEDRVLVEAWLPLALDEWNGRFLATGGGGFTTGMFDAHLGTAVREGWAAVSTDGGHDANRSSISDASWAVYDTPRSERGQNDFGTKSVKWNLLHNFASRSAIDQIIVGKSITEQYYGAPPHHSYWNGCSTGGRQGYAIAQRHPELVDGILANAPATNFANLVTAEFLPQLLMKEANTYLSKCELEYFRMKAVEECDMLDGVKDGLLHDPEACEFRASMLVGDVINCDGQDVKITSKMADIVEAIHDGPRDAYGGLMFPGLAWGVPMNTLANIAIAEDGTRSQNPFPISIGWLKDLVLRGTVKDLSQLRLEQYADLWIRANRDFGPLLNTDNPDFSRLRGSQTKLLTWHGLNDQMIPFQNTVSYRKKVESIMGGSQAVDEYYRLFLAPGVEHCGGGSGPQPKDALKALVDWVESGIVPETLDADIIDQEGDLVTKDICAFPGKSKYMGIGDAKRASTWTCEGRIKEGMESDIENGADGIHYGSMKSGLDELNRKGEKVTRRTNEILKGLKGRIEALGLGLRAT